MTNCRCKLVSFIHDEMELKLDPACSVHNETSGPELMSAWVEKAVAGYLDAEARTAYAREWDRVPKAPTLVADLSPVVAVKNPFLVHSRTGSAKAGPQTARLVPCTKSQYHGHHPENEDCQLCEPVRKVELTVNDDTEWLSIAEIKTRFARHGIEHNEQNASNGTVTVWLENSAGSHIGGCYDGTLTKYRLADRQETWRELYKAAKKEGWL
jgi:hypothetical protein